MGFELDEATVRAKYGEGWNKKPSVNTPPVEQSANGEPVGNENKGQATKYDAGLINAYSMGLERLSKLGLKVPETFVRDAFSIPVPKNDERSLTSPSAESGQSANANLAEASATYQPDALDSLIQAEQAQWLPAMDPLALTIRHFWQTRLHAVKPQQKFWARLPELLPQLNADLLSDSLTNAAFTARLAANAGIDNE